MKKILIVVIIIIIKIGSCGNCQYFNFSRASNGTNAIVIPNGEVWKIVNWSAAENPENYNYFGINIGDGELKFRGTNGNLVSIENSGSGYYLVGLIICGPCTLEPRPSLASSNLEYFMTVEKIISSGSSLSVSASSVVIPTSASGDVDVKMEQSADNVTWTECLPGTYNSSTVKRFFRLRAVEK